MDKSYRTETQRAKVETSGQSAPQSNKTHETTKIRPKSLETAQNGKMLDLARFGLFCGKRAGKGGDYRGTTGELQGTTGHYRGTTGELQGTTGEVPTMTKK